MPRFAYVNGRYVPHQRACVHVEDRGYQLADGVYEVLPVIGGRLVDEAPHLDRLDRSLGELSIRWPMPRRALELVARELLRRNRLRDGLLYIQVTRGVAPRDHAFPGGDVAPALVMTTMRRPPPRRADQVSGVAVVTTPDIRWKRCDIKTISLLPNVLAKQMAREAKCVEAWMVDPDGQVTEGASTNAWIVTADGALVTRRADSAILNGVTRQRIIALARDAGLRFEERPFSLAEARQAREAFLSSSSNLVMPVVRIDDAAIGDGKPGPLACRLRDAYLAQAASAG
ncbi:MAG: D-amino-acid transaminase [Alphaproteobacteria bacterium]